MNPMVNPLLAIAISLFPNFQIIANSKALCPAVRRDEERLGKVGLQYGVVWETADSQRHIHEQVTINSVAAPVHVVIVNSPLASGLARFGLERHHDLSTGVRIGGAPLLNREGKLPGHKSRKQDEQCHGCG